MPSCEWVLEATSAFTHPPINAKHTVATFLAMGTGTSERFDDVPFDESGNYNPNREVNRLYIEYCEKGDLDGYTSKFDNRRQNLIFPTEEHVWRIFGCLAKACLVLETGSEDPDTPDPNHVYPM